MKLVEYEQPTSAPVPKVAAAAQAGVIVTAIMTILALSGVIVPDGVSQAAQNAISVLAILVPAVQTVVMFVAAYFKKDKKPAAAVPIIQAEGGR